MRVGDRGLPPVVARLERGDERLPICVLVVGMVRKDGGKRKEPRKLTTYIFSRVRNLLCSRRNALVSPS